MLTHNKNEHNTTGMTRVEVTKEYKQLDVKLIFKLKARSDRTYPEIKITNTVNIMLKYDKFGKEHKLLYSALKCEIDQKEEKHGIYCKCPYTLKG